MTTSRRPCAEPAFTSDRTTVFLHGYYTFDQLLEISMDDRLASRDGLASVQDITDEEHDKLHRQADEYEARHHWLDGDDS